MACVKADAYGHDSKISSDALTDCVDGFAVACMDEALELRQHGVVKPILILEGPHSRDEIDEAIHHKLILCICEKQQIDWIEKTAPVSPLTCWLKVDTGMHRLGFSPRDTPSALERLQPFADPSALVVCTHFASADQPGENDMQAQLQRFDHSIAGQKVQQSTANSAAIFRDPASHRDWVRPGYMLYGGSPLADTSAQALALKPAMELSARVIGIRSIEAGERVGYGGRWVARRISRIATIAIGYGDGYPRHAADGTPVMIEGRRLPLVGRVSMDMIMVDVTDHPAAGIGSLAILWGADPGIDEVAMHANTIGYELLAGLPKRVPRIRET